MATEVRPLVRRHRLSTRLWHWVNALTLLVMLMSGLMIFNAHPRLYWGEYGANFDPPWLEIGADGERGYLRIADAELTTTGLLGARRGDDGAVQRSAFPGWATIPSGYSLADARLWHLAFAWVLALGLIAYLLWSALNRHLWRDLAPSRGVRSRCAWRLTRLAARKAIRPTASTQAKARCQRRPAARL